MIMDVFPFRGVLENFWFWNGHQCFAFGAFLSWLKNFLQNLKVAAIDFMKDNKTQWNNSKTSEILYYSRITSRIQSTP